MMMCYVRLSGVTDNCHTQLSHAGAGCWQWGGCVWGGEEGIMGTLYFELSSAIALKGIP